MASFGEIDFHNSGYGNSRQHYDFPPPQQEYVLEENPDDDSIKRYMGTGVSLVSLIVENLLSHPFVVLRRQCQVHHTSKKNHLVPVTLAPVIIHLHMRQGLTTLWKGIGSVCMTKGVSLAVEDCASKITTWPKDINNCNSALTFGKHLLLKSISLAIVTPLYCASFVETVQSDIASDKPGFLDVFKDGALRVISCSPGGRLLPIWNIMIPTVAMGISKYLFSISFKGVVAKVLKFRQRYIEDLKGSYGKTTSSSSKENNQFDEIEMSAVLTTSIASEILFYPIELIVHRLYLQGTRTIIDNLDTGNSVLPILTDYEGFFDCYHSIMAQEGSVGLYKGFGALLLQFAIHLAVIKITKAIITGVSDLLKPASVKPALTASSSQQSLYSQQRYLIS